MKHRFRRTTLQLIGFLAFLAGVGLARLGYPLSAGWWLLALLIVALSYRRRSLWALAAILWFGLALGLWRGATYVQRLAAYEPLFKHAVVMTVRATDDAVYGQNSQLSFDADHILLTDGRQLTGKLQISGFGPGAIYQGDVVQVSGAIYPTLGASQGRVSFAKLKVLERHPTLVANLRRRFTAGMQTALPEPLAPFAMGLLIGQRATLPADVKQQLLMVGLTHIIAVSGYNLTIMLEASRKILGGRSKRLSTMLSLSLMAVFLLLAGTSASIVRAAIVSTLSIAAGYYGRSFRPFNLIALAAAITAFANPFYVWGDSSWYLSFLAFYGVMVLSPLLSRHLQERLVQSIVVGVALESICAEIMTLPFILHTFGQMSFVGLPANVLVVTLVPLAMLLSLIAGLGGMFAGSLAGWIAWPARILLTYMLDISRALSHLPHIFVQNLGLSAAQMTGLYLLVLLITAALMLKYGKITDKKA